MTDYLRLDIGAESPDIVTAGIEIPRGSSNKYKYDKKSRAFKLDLNLHSPRLCPTDYGCMSSVAGSMFRQGIPAEMLVNGSFHLEIADASNALACAALFGFGESAV